VETAQLKEIAVNVRKDIVTMIAQAGSGHPGGSLSAVEIMVALYFREMKFSAAKPLDPGRDYFVLSKGHACPVLYAVLAQLKCIESKELCTLRKAGSRLQGHPSKDREVPGIEVSTGSLGYGLSIGVGAALGHKREHKPNRVYVLMGDGEQQEGSIWEAAMAAGQFKLDNLCGIVDLNGLQIDGKVTDVMGVEPMADKYRSFGWNTIEVNGHDIDAVSKAFEAAKAFKGKPTVILARTVKGKGVSFMENNADWHGKAPNKEQTEQALKEIA
jgi:transketolase